MSVWPAEYEDTINYRTREFVSQSDITVRMIDEAILSLWGNVFHNGQRLVYSPYVDLSAFGVQYNGSDEAALFQKAIDESPGYTHLHISGPLKLGTPVLAKDTYTITGEGWQSPISPTPSFPVGQPLLEFRHAVTAVGSKFSHLAGIVLDNLVFDGINRTIRCNGLRLNATQEGFFSRIRFHNIDGIGLDIYNSVRDSIFQSNMSRMCGNYDRDEAGISIITRTGQAQDSHNNLCFLGLYSHVGMGDLLHIQCETPNNVRCFFFLGCKFHGVWTPGYVDADGITYDHRTTGRVVIRNARGVEFTNCRFHESAAGMPLIHVSAHPLQLGVNSVNGVGIAQSSLGNPGSQMTGSVTAAVDNELKFAVTHYFSKCMMVRATASDVTGIDLATDYFVIRVDSLTIKLASTYANAEAGVAMITGSTGSVSLSTQECRVFTPEGTYGRVYLHPGIDIDGTSSRPPFVNKSHFQVMEPDIGSKYLLPGMYEGIVTQSDPFNHIEVDGDINHDGTKAGFFNTTPVVQPTGVTASQALESLGLGTSLIGGAFYAEYPPLTRTIGQLWYMPSAVHSAIWSGTQWKPVTPSDPNTNACCVIGNLDFYTDMNAWDGVNASGNWKNYGLVSGLNWSANAAVTQGVDGNNKYAVFGTGEASILGSPTWDIGVADSFSLFVVKNQTVFVANHALFGNRQAPSSTTEAGWGLMIADANGAHRFRIADGTVSTDATGNASTGMKMVLGVRDVTADNIVIYGSTIEQTTNDATTASLVTVNIPKIGRASGTGTSRPTMNLYAAGFTRKALTTAEIATLKSWLTSRFS